MSKSKGQRKVIIQKIKDHGNLPETKALSSRRHILKVLIALFLILATLTVFLGVRNYEFMELDDDVYVTDNPHVQAGLTLKVVTWALTTTHASNWHPLTWLSHILDYELYGLWPGGHHLTNLLLHIINAVLLFLVLEKMTGALWGTSFVAALFALHPLHVESVAWVAERKDVLSTFFWMLTMWTYVHYAERPRLDRYLLVLLSFALGLLSKPMLVSLPFVLLLLDYWPLGRLQFGQWSGNRNSHTHKSMNPSDQRSVALRLVLEKTPFFALSAVSSLLTLFAQQRGGLMGSLESYPLGTRISNALVSYVGYIGKMIWPHHLAFFYPYPNLFPLWQVAGAGLLLLFVSVLLIRAARRRPYLMVGWFWYLGTLVPVIGLVQVGSQAMADRYTYVPLVGLFIVIATGVPDFLAGWRYRRIVLVISAGLLLSILMIVTRLQIQHWHNGVTLFKHSLDVTANNSLSQNGLGVALARRGKSREAIVHYAEALRINPHFADAHNNLGNVLVRQGKYQEAIAHYTEALRIKPDFAKAHNNLAVALVRQGKYQEAIARYAEALRIKPDYADAHNNLGVALARQGKHQEAIDHYGQALRIKPDYAEAYGNLGNSLAEQGRIEEAIVHYTEALRINPNFAGVYNNLGNALVRQGKIQEAIVHYTKALRINPDFAEAHFFLGLAYLMIGNRDSALEEHKILKTINPNLANTLSHKIFK